jgi:3-hydroxyisobutyrate dehydrogenase
MAATTAEKIGFVGLGHMGGSMAARFLAAGYPVYGEERDRAHAEELIREGLQWRDTPREVAEAADVLFTSLPDDGVLEAVASGPDGILAGLTAAKAWVDMSTVSPAASRGLAERVRALGASMLDAPVSGSVPQVQAGTLTIMVGGDKDAYARVEPLLRLLGSPTHIGENGQGLVLKLAINISLAAQMLAFAEGLLLAERAGVDRRLAACVMTASPIGSPMLKARVALVLDLPEEAWFDIGLMQKDVALALDTGRQLRVPLPSAAVADELLTVSRALGYGRRDLAALFEVLAQIAGGHGSADGE